MNLIKKIHANKMNFGSKFTKVKRQEIRMFHLAAKQMDCNSVITHFVKDEISRLQYLKLINSTNGCA